MNSRRPMPERSMEIEKNKCVICGVYHVCYPTPVATARKLLDHLRTHLAAQPFSCTECPYTAKTATVVAAHTGRKHHQRSELCVDNTTPELLESLKGIAGKAYPLQVKDLTSYIDELINSKKQLFVNPFADFLQPLEDEVKAPIVSPEPQGSRKGGPVKLSRKRPSSDDGENTAPPIQRRKGKR
ncbi:unnamed protein product, partial [Mesorhabditis spiculigera]